jgi:hypothetical protein
MAYLGVYAIRNCKTIWQGLKDGVVAAKNKMTALAYSTMLKLLQKEEDVLDLMLWINTTEDFAGLRKLLKDVEAQKATMDVEAYANLTRGIENRIAALEGKLSLENKLANERKVADEMEGADAGARGDKLKLVDIPEVSNLPRQSAFRHKFTSGVTVYTDEPFGTFLIGSFRHDLEQVLNELNYPTIARVDFNFPVPANQKFNLLNITIDEYTYWVNNGGFFTKVNGPWIDAAVSSKQKIIVTSDMAYAYSSSFIDNIEVFELTGFGKELHRLEWKHGYRYDPLTHTMVPPELAKDLKPITKEIDYIHN